MTIIRAVRAALVPATMTAGVGASSALADIFDGSFEAQGAAGDGCIGSSCPEAPWRLQRRVGPLTDPGFA